MRIVSLVIFLLGVTISSSILAASFDCAKASIKVQKMICSDSELSLLVEDINQLFKSVIEKYDGNELQKIRFEYELWIDSIEVQCGNDKKCLTQAFQRQLNEINGCIHEESFESILNKSKHINLNELYLNLTKNKCYGVLDHKLLISDEVQLIGTDKTKKTRWNIYQDSKENGFVVSLPIDQHAFKSPFSEIYKGSISCSFNGLESGRKIFTVIGNNKIYILESWSCGRLGCSYEYYFTNLKLNNVSDFCFFDNVKNIPTNSVSEKSDFEIMLNGFKKCQFDDVYLPSGKVDMAKHTYFQKRNLIPYKKENSLAYYRIKETFLGMPVTEIVIPITYDYHIITIDLPIQKVIPILSRDFKGLYRVNSEDDDGSIPILRPHNQDSNKSIFYCSEI